MIKVKLDELLDEKNITILQLSEASGISRSTLNSMVNGTTKGIQFSTIETICNFFKCNINDLIEFTPTVEAPTLKSIHVNHEEENVYYILFIYSFATRRGLEHTGVRLRIRVTDDNQIILNMNIANDKEIVNSVLDMKISNSNDIKVSKRLKKDDLFLKKEVDNYLMPKDGKERFDSLVKHYNLSIENWDKLREHIDSIEGSITFKFSEKMDITDFFSVPYTTRTLFNSISVSDKNIIDKIRNDKERLISKNVQAIVFEYSLTKSSNREDSKISEKDLVNLDFYPYSASASFSEIEYSELKTFDENDDTEE